MNMAPASVGYWSIAMLAIAICEINYCGYLCGSCWCDSASHIGNRLRVSIRNAGNNSLNFQPQSALVSPCVRAVNTKALPRRSIRLVCPLKNYRHQAHNRWCKPVSPCLPPH